MGAAVFAMVFFGILILGIILVLAGIIFLLARRMHNRNRAVPKKMIAPGIVIGAGVVCLFITAGILMFLRNANGRKPAEGYVDMDREAYWNFMSEDAARITFEYEGTRYIEIRPHGIDDNYVSSKLDSRYIPKDQAFVNIRTKQGFWDKVFNYDDSITLYELENDSGAFIIGSDLRLYCGEDDLAQVTDYYTDLSHYNYFLENSDGLTRRKIDLDPEKVTALADLTAKADSIGETADIPDSSGTIVEFDSRDGLFTGQFFIGEYEGRLYVYAKSADDMIFVRLPEDLEQYFRETLK